MASQDELNSLLAKLDQSRQRIQDLLAPLPRDAEIYPGWTKKELIAHLTGWEDAVLGTLQAHASGTPPELPSVYRGNDYYNNQSVIERADLTFEQIAAEWKTVRQQVIAVVNAMPSEQKAVSMTFPWGQVGPVGTLVEGMVLDHELGHIAEIEKILGTR